MDEARYTGFLDLLYGGAVESGGWEKIIASFADLVGGARVWMPHINLRDGSGTGVIARLDPAAQATYFEYYATLNPFVQPMLGDPEGPWPLTVNTDEDVFPKADLARTEYFNDFLRPQEIHSVMIVRLGRSDGIQTTINVTRPRHREQFAGADLELARRLQPDLIRALGLSRKFADLGAATAGLAETLEHSAHAVLLLDASGRILHANAPAERLLREGDGLCVVQGRLSATKGEAARRLAALVGRAAGPDGVRTGGALALPTAGRILPLSVTVAPLQAQRPTARGRTAAVLVCVTDLEAGDSLGEHRLRELFRLTAAEARLALAMFEGLAPKDAARRFGVSPHTVKMQLRHIFEKTGVNRQVDLVRLMSRIGGFSAAS